MRQVGTKIQGALLREFKCSHHLPRVFAEKIAPLGVQLLVTDKKGVADRGFIRSYQRKKTEKRSGPARNMAAYKLLGNTLCHAEDVSRVLVIVSHERFTAELAISMTLIEPVCALFLQVNAHP